VNTSQPLFRDPILQDALSDFQSNPSWSANLFLYYFFIYILNPFDIDGDNKFSVTDAYKFAGIQTNIQLNHLKRVEFLKASLEIAKGAIISFDNSNANKDDLDNQEGETKQALSQKSLEDLYNLFGTVLINQNPWILNANFSRTLEIKL
jgi:hypothetical protein